MKNIFKLLLVSLIFTACEDVEPTIYNSSDTSPNNTFLSFSRTVYSLPVVQNEDGTVTLTLNSSTVSSVDRVYNLEIIDTDELTTADPSTYTFPSTITIPAGSYQGTAVITGVDNGVTQEIKTIDFRITDLNGESMDVNQITVNIYEVCPLQDDFTGTYSVEQLTPGLGTPILQTGRIVTISVGDSEYERVFSTGTYHEFGNAVREFRINFSCGQTFLAQEIVAAVQCTADNLITLGPAAPGNASSYNTNDDTVFELTVTEDTTSSCDAPIQTTFRFTKV